MFVDSGRRWQNWNAHAGTRWTIGQVRSLTPSGILEGALTLQKGKGPGKVLNEWLMRYQKLLSFRLSFTVEEHLNKENWALRNSVKSWLSVLSVSKLSVQQIFVLLKGGRLMQWKKIWCGKNQSPSISSATNYVTLDGQLGQAVLGFWWGLKGMERSLPSAWSTEHAWQEHIAGALSLQCRPPPTRQRDPLGCLDLPFFMSLILRALQ